MSPKRGREISAALRHREARSDVAIHKYDKKNWITSLRS
jgi:hypothetical protein